MKNLIQKKENYLKKTKKLNKDKQIIGYFDQTFCDKNSPPKILGKRGYKNELIIKAKRIHQTAMGFQAINGVSHLSFPENSRSHNIMIFMAELRMKNLSNKSLLPYFNFLINDSSIQRKTNAAKFNIESMGEKEFSEKIKNIGKTKGYKKTFIKTVNKLIYKENKQDEFKIDTLIRFQLLDNLENLNIKSLMENEKEIVVILDNYKPHHSTELKKFCELLNIKLLYLPAYTPQYNPIEQVWKSIKRIIYDPTISDRDELIRIFEEEYYIIIYNHSFFEKWEEKFL